MDILKCRVYLVSPGIEKYRGRLMTCFQRLVDRGFHTVEFVRSLPGTGKTDSLSTTTAWILEQEMGRNDPFIILDDDIECLPRDTTVAVPDGACAVYLGVARWVYPFHFETLGKGFQIRPMTHLDCDSHDDALVRIRGMLSSHAILFLDRGFVGEMLFKIRQDHTIPHDLILATMQHRHPVYALKEPLFYQDASIGGREDITRLRWSPDRSCFI